MISNPLQEVEGSFLLRYMSVKRMKEILEEIPDDYLLIPNTVGNLRVANDEEYIGYIDFNEETFEKVD